MNDHVSRFLKDGTDGSVIKYGLIVIVILLAIVTAALGIAANVTAVPVSTTTTLR